MRAPEFWMHDGLLAHLLAPASWLWQAGATARFGRSTAERAPVPVICVGNVVAGGAGKTPVALAVADSLRRQGHTPHFLSRGHGGSEAGPLRIDPANHDARTVGDEPLLLAAAGPAWIARDRIAGARAAAAAGADIIVMDDGFQNPAIAKDLSFLVVDGGYGFGNGRVMPAGPLREPIETAVARADAVVVVGVDAAGVAASLGDRLPLLAARFVPVPDADDISGRRVVAFAGIGRPAKFFETVAGMGCDIVAAQPFADHHRYDPDEVMKLVETAAAADAIAVTTEKDAVRLPAAARAMVHVLRVTLEWRDADALDRLTRSVFGSR